MSLTAGSKVGPYEIVAPIGAGGMGEVYRARDSKLKREVAIKILPEAFARDPERMARFQREAEVLASLNHPNIAAIYGVEERALVMELVEGESPSGPMPFEEAWRVASQIADALEYAHDKGVVHRDLKPANVKVTPEGVVKLLDFGLAKAFSDPMAGAASGGDLSNSPTMTIGATVAGTILGTAAYMSPEQAKGKRADKRADIWAWGVVLHELLTGERLFQGEDAADTLAQVLTKTPDLGRVPLEARGVIAECLKKDPKERLRDIGDAKRLINLQGMALHHPPSRLRYVLAAAVGLALIAVAIDFAFFHFRATPADTLPMQLAVSLPEDASVRSLALSPDGRNLVVAMVVGEKYGLWVRALDSTEFRELPGTDQARVPFWSPDGRFIGFFADAKLKTIPATGGPATVLCDAVSAQGGTWSKEGVILFATRSLQRVAQTGGTCTPLTETSNLQGFPEFLPDGRHFFYVQVGPGAEQGVYVASLDEPKGRRVLADQSSVAYLPPAAGDKLGTLLFLRENVLMAQPLDSSMFQPAGDVVTVAQHASFSNSRPQMAASLSAGGILAYLANGETEGSRSQLVWMDRQGKEVGKIGNPGESRMLSLSPDEKTLAFNRPEGGSALSALWLRDLVRGSEIRFNAPGERSYAPVWAPQANRLIFAGSRTGTASTDLYSKEIGGGRDELLLKNGNAKYPSDWSKDGRYLVYTEVDPQNRGDIWYLQDPLSKERKAVPFQATPSNESQGQLSPDGHLIAYASNESSQYEVYVRPFPEGPGKWLVSIKGGREPRWRKDGKELFYLEGLIPRLRMMAVAVTPGARPAFGAPQMLFEFRANTVLIESNGFSYNAASGGQRFLVNGLIGGERATLNVMLNWQKGMGGPGR